LRRSVPTPPVAPHGRGVDEIADAASHRRPAPDRVERNQSAAQAVSLIEIAEQLGLDAVGA
jgi:hypothetical protein